MPSTPIYAIAGRGGDAVADLTAGLNGCAGGIHLAWAAANSSSTAQDTARSDRGVACVPCVPRGNANTTPSRASTVPPVRRTIACPETMNTRRKDDASTAPERLVIVSYTTRGRRVSAAFTGVAEPSPATVTVTYALIRARLADTERAVSVMPRTRRGSDLSLFVASGRWPWCCAEPNEQKQELGRARIRYVGHQRIDISMPSAHSSWFSAQPPSQCSCGLRNMKRSRSVCRLTSNGAFGGLDGGASRWLRGTHRQPMRSLPTLILRGT